MITYQTITPDLENYEERIEEYLQNEKLSLDISQDKHSKHVLNLGSHRFIKTVAANQSFSSLVGDDIPILVKDIATPNSVPDAYISSLVNNKIALPPLQHQLVRLPDGEFSTSNHNVVHLGK